MNESILHVSRSFGAAVDTLQLEAVLCAVTRGAQQQQQGLSVDSAPSHSHAYSNALYDLCTRQHSLFIWYMCGVLLIS